MTGIPVSWKRGLLAAVAIVVSLLVIYQLMPRPSPSPEGARPPLTDLQNVAPLREQFNRDAGMPRLILLASPT